MISFAYLFVEYNPPSRIPVHLRPNKVPMIPAKAPPQIPTLKQDPVRRKLDVTDIEGNKMYLHYSEIEGDIDTPQRHDDRGQKRRGRPRKGEGRGRVIPPIAVTTRAAKSRYEQ